MYFRWLTRRKSDKTREKFYPITHAMGVLFGDGSETMQNRMLSHEGSHKIKTYTNFSDIGITIGSETILGIAAAMTDDSELRTAVSSESGNNTEIYPTAEGTLYVKRTSETKIFFEFSRSVNEVSADSKYTTVWRGEANVSTSTWNGWKKVFDDSNLPTPEQIGAMYFIDYTGSSKDLDVLIKSGTHAGFYMTDGDTKGTPYKKGVTTLASAMVFSFSKISTYAVQYAFVPGIKRGLTFCRTLDNGTIGDWISFETHHSVMTYTSLAQIGLNDSNFGNTADSLVGNLSAINAAVPSGTAFIMHLQAGSSANGNLRLSLLNKIYADVGVIPSSLSGGASIFIKRGTDPYCSMLVDVIYEHKSVETYTFSTVYNKDYDNTERVNTFVITKSKNGFFERNEASISADKLATANGFGGFTAADGSAAIENYKSGSIQYSGLEVSAKNALTSIVRAYRITGTADSPITNYYELHGKFNKPTGSYSGNGSATTRTVAIGGIGKLLFVYSGSYDFGFVTPKGAWFYNSSGGGVTKALPTECKYEDGTLTIASTNAKFNASGTTYYYQCL